MGYTIINDDVLDNEELNIQEQSVLIALISYYNNGKGYAYPSYKQLKLRSKLKDNRTLIKTVDSLVEKGYLTKETLKGIGVKYYITKCIFTPSGELHLVENYTRCKNTLPPSGKSHYDLVENYTTTNNKTNNKTNKNIYSLVIGYLNKKAGTKYRSTTKKTQSCINARINEGFKEDDFYTVIDNKVNEWQDTDMEKYLRPETLFGSKFEGYLNQKSKGGNQNNNTKDYNEWLNNRKKKTVL